MAGEMRWNPLPEINKRGWELIVNLGDMRAIGYEGYFIYKDRQGVYPEQAEKVLIDDKSDPESEYTVYRFVLDRFELVGEYLVPFDYDTGWPSHPEQYDAWFHDRLGYVAAASDTTTEAIERALISADPIQRALAYDMLGSYFGWANMGAATKRLTREGAQRRYVREVRPPRR